MQAYPGMTPMQWLADTPSILVRVCLSMLPRLEAEASIRRINEAATAFGTAGEAASSSFQRGLAALASTSAAEPRRPDPGALHAHGIPVRRIPRAKAKAS